MIKTSTYDGYGNILESKEVFYSETILAQNEYEVPDKLNWRFSRINRMKKILNGVIVEDKKITFSNREIASTSNLFDSEKNLWVSTRYENYDSYGNPTKIIGPDNSSTILEYDSFSRTNITSVKNESTGLIMMREFDKNTNKVLVETDSSGVVSKKEYDVFGRLTNVYYPGSQIPNETYKYVLDNPNLIYVEKILDDGSINGFWTKEYLNPIGQKIKLETKGYVENGNSVSLFEETEYDIFNRVIKKSNQYLQGNPVYYTNYIFNGPFKKLSRIEKPDGSSTDITYLNGLSEKVVTTGVSSLGNSEIIDTTILKKNYKGEIISKFSNNKTITYDSGFDSKGRYIKVYSDSGKLKVYDRINLAGKKVFHQDTNTGISKMEYDLLGNLKTKTNAANKSIHFTYDSLNRLVKVDRPDLEDDEFYFYDEGNDKGRLSRVITKHYSATLSELKDEIITKHKYSQNGQLDEKVTEIDSQKYVFKYRYDKLGRLKKIFYQNGISVNSIYSDSGHLSEVSMDSADGTNLNNSLVKYAALPDYRLQRLLGNNVETYLKYNPINQRVESVSTKLKQNNEVQKWFYTYDSFNNIKKIEDSINPINTEDFEYDSTGRMTSARGAYGPSENKVQTETYEYDPETSNLTKKGNMNYLYSDSKHVNAVTMVKIQRGPSIQDIFYSYDLNGNMVSRDTDLFEFDSQNRMTKSTIKNHLNEYLYDHNGNRIRKKTGQNNVTVYTIDGIYEVTKNPSKADMHTMYIRGLKGDLVSQFSQENIVLINETSFNNLKIDFTNRIANYSNLLFQKTKIYIAKFIFLELEKNPYQIKLYIVFYILVSILILSFLHFNNLIKIKENFIFLPNLPSLNKFISLLTIYSILFLFSNCSPNSSSANNKIPFWALGGFTTQTITVDTPSIPNAPNNNPAGSNSFGAPNSNIAGSPVMGMYFFSPNHLGSTSMITNYNGDMVTGVDINTGKSYVTYKPFGEVNRTNSDGPDIFRYKYSSKEEDSESGLQYFNARYYDASIGRFISADTIIDASSEQGMDQYAFVNNSPINYRDPSGRFLAASLFGAFATAFMAVASAVVSTVIVAAAIGVAVIGAIGSALSFGILPVFMSVGIAGLYFARNSTVVKAVDKYIENYKLFLKATVYIGIAVIAIAVGVLLMAFGGPVGFIIGATLVGFGIGATIGYLSGGLGGLIEKGKWDQKEAESRYASYGVLGAKTGFIIGVTGSFGYSDMALSKMTPQALGYTIAKAFISGAAFFTAVQFVGYFLVAATVVATVESEGKPTLPFGDVGEGVFKEIRQDVLGNKAKNGKQNNEFIREKLPYQTAFLDYIAFSLIVSKVTGIDSVSIYIFLTAPLLNGIE